MPGIVAHEAVLKEAVLRRDVIVAAFPSFSGDRGLDAQHTPGHLAGPENPTGSVGQEDVLALEVEPGSNRVPRYRPSEAGLKLSDALEGSNPDAGVIVHHEADR